MSMNYMFEINDAIAYGVNEAIFLYNLKYWIKINEANEKHFYDGKTWTYNSKRAYAELFPFWTERQIKTIINSLINQGVIVKGEYNKSKYDRTSWYALSDEKDGIDRTKKSSQTDQEVQPIPNKLSNNNNSITSKISKREFSIAQGMYDLILFINPKHKKPNLDKWANTIRLMKERDGREYQDIVALFRWANKHDFWRNVILSPDNLRKKYDMLYTQMMSVANDDCQKLEYRKNCV